VGAGSGGSTKPGSVAISSENAGKFENLVVGTTFSTSSVLAGIGADWLFSDTEEELSAVIVSPKLRSASSRLISSLAEALLTKETKTKSVRA
jgi:hypothetical protein